MKVKGLSLGIAGLVLGFVLVLVTKTPALVTVIWGSGCWITAFALGRALGEREERGRWGREMYQRQIEATMHRWPC